MNDMRTPLSRVRGLGSAKAGTRDFWIQRLTAAANVPLALLLIAFVVALTSADYANLANGGYNAAYPETDLSRLRP
jgi:succinate dehydrogenase / fumarate reductase, membrane anchor subunit